MFKKNKKIGLLVSGVAISGIMIVVVSIVFMQKQKGLVDYHIDSSPLRSAISTSDTVQIVDFGTDTVLYESRDVEEINWLRDAIVVDSHNTRTQGLLMTLPRYRLIFYKDSATVVELWLKGGLCFHWIHGSWDWTFDFVLTYESNRKIIPWLCEKSEKTAYELFPDPSMPSWARGLPNEEGLKFYWRGKGNGGKAPLYSRIFSSWKGASPVIT